MKKKKLYYLIVVLIIPILIFAILSIRFRNTTSLLLSGLTHTLPSFKHVERIRNNLLNQDNFMILLREHEKIALNNYRNQNISYYTKLYIYKTPISMFDIPTMHDYWETWVRTDIVDGRPYTSFLVRLGMIKDANAVNFFSSQCKSILCKKVFILLINLYNKMYDRNILMPFRLNITELNETSSVDHKRISKDDWEKRTKQYHFQGIGITFTK